jgi:hypothetical protein
MSENERTCDCIYFCYCLEEEGDLDHDYPNPTIHCNCGAIQEWAEIPTCNCGIEEFDTFFDCIEERYCILCLLWTLDLETLLPWYLARR